MIENLRILFVWMGRILAISNIAIFLYFGIGEGFPNLMVLPKYEFYQMLLWLVMIISSIFAFKWEMIFGIVILLAYLGFNYMQYLATNGNIFWTGYILFIYPLSGILFIISWFLSKKVHLDKN